MGITRDPYVELANQIRNTAKEQAAGLLQNATAELGVILPTMELKLDRFKNPLPHYLIADWMVRLEVPEEYERVFITASPVKSEQTVGEYGQDIPEETGYSKLTRMDFKQLDPETSEIRDVGEFAVHVNLKVMLRPGDRVLAIAANTEYIVVSKVVASDG